MDLKQQSTTKETYQFNADINQLMNLIINTFYSNKEVFLRELVSNASDALDKIRFKGLKDKNALGSQKELKITLLPNKEAKTLVIEDTGIGMTKNDLVQNLGTIAKSGTKQFMEAIKSGSDLSMIGQFGVGFYSAFLVADKVMVETKHNDEQSAYRWTSNAEQSFVIEKYNDETLVRGTRITLYLKDDQLDYLEESKLKQLIKKHNEFISYPISLWITKEIEKEVEEEVEQDDDTDKPVVEEVEEDTKEKKKTIKEKVSEWELVNNQKPIWLRSKEELKEEDYKQFYKSFSNDWEDYLSVKHFKVEGQIEFRSLLFIPKKAPFDMFGGANATKNNIKLYVRRVFIMDDCKDLMPDYLSFVKGVVDSEDLPLNVSREMLQQSRILRVIKKQLVKKSIDMMRDLQDNKDSFKLFYEEFSKNIKLGIHEDSQNREKLAELLRFNSYHNDENYISLDQYIENMKPEQKHIYYITGENKHQVQQSPFLEKIKKKGYDVLFMTEAIDEYVLQNLKIYKDKQLQSITKENVELNDSEEEKKVHKENEELFKNVIERMKKVLDKKIEKVVISNRLESSPCCLTTSEFGWSANMERIMKAQALRNNKMSQFMVSKKTLEINPKHKIVRYIKDKIALSEDNNETQINSFIHLLYNTALLTSGFSIEKPSEYGKYIYNLIETGLDMDDEPNRLPEIVVENQTTETPLNNTEMEEVD